jgi:integrase
MPTLSRNHRQIASAKAIAGKRTQYRIEGVVGLVLDVRPNNTRTWFVRYQNGSRTSRKFRWYKIGDATAIGLAQATERAKSIVAAVQDEGRDPVQERIETEREAQMFGELFEQWMTRYAEPRLARAGTDRIIYRNHLEPAIGRTALGALTRQEIARLRDEIAAKATPLTSNSAIGLVSRVLNWALDEGKIEVNPVARLRKAGTSKPRERVLAPMALKTFWNGLAAMDDMTGEHMALGTKGRMLSPATRRILRLLLLTGQRRTEVTGARKEELQLDGDEPVWTIPGERTKNGLLHRVPLPPLAAEEFRRAVSAASSRSQFVFASPDDHRHHITPLAVTRAMARFVAELEIPKVSPHDLRRTVGTELARLGVPLHVRSLVLNHSPQSRGVTDAVYNRYAYDKEKREALLAWERCLSQLVSASRSVSPT